MAVTNEVTAGAATAAAPKAAKPSEAGPSAGGAITSDFETFLRMLTTQMQNQDPLEPMKSDELSVQLATFSGVEQQVRTNDLLSGLSARFGAAGLTEYSGWVGKDARAAAPVHFDGATPVSVAAKPPLRADTASLVARNEDGAEVYRQPISPQGETVIWDGKATAGGTVASGLYTFTVESAAGGTALDDVAAEPYAKVAEARIENGSVFLVLAGNVKVAAQEVTAIKAPDLP